MPRVEIIELDVPRSPAPAPASAATPPPRPPPSPSPPPPPPAATVAPIAPSPVKLYVATPCYGCNMTLAFLASLLGLQGECTRRGIQCVVDCIGNESLVERARNIMVARFLETDATHLLFIDADIGFSPQSVFRLVDVDKDVATGVYSKKAFDWDGVRAKLGRGDPEPVHQMGLDFNINIAENVAQATNGFVKVLDSATGFMLIKRGVLERMAEHFRPSLDCVNDIPNQSIKTYVALFACMIDPVTRRFLSEDYSFCRRYQELGGEIWSDIAMPLSHIGMHTFSGDVRERLPAAAPPAVAAR